MAQKARRYIDIFTKVLFRSYILCLLNNKHYNDITLRRLYQISKRNTKFSIFCLMICSGLKKQKKNLFFLSGVPTLDLNNKCILKEIFCKYLA